MSKEPAWILKWQAREALTNGQPEEAHRILDQLVASGNRRAFALRGDVVKGYLDRAERSLRRDDVEAAWSDLLKVEGLAPNDSAVAKLRETLIRHGLAEIRATLEYGKPLQAIEAIVQLRERPVHSPELTILEEATQDWVLAQEIAERGDFELARQALERVRRRIVNRTAGLERFEEKLTEKEERFRSAWNRLQDALAKQQWRETMQTADEVLAVAPRHRDAQQARNKAWQNVQAPTVAIHKPSPAVSVIPAASARTESVAGLPKRFFLWIDGVGSYLVCLNHRITIGQATTDGPIDVPIFADISRIHAALSRDEESYVLETNRSVLVNGNAVERAILQCGDKLAMTNSCHFQFRLPVPGCNSARLDPLAGRRLPMAVDGILLMSDMLLIGPGDKVHIRIPDLAKPIYLFRQKEELGIRYAGPFHVEGESCQDRAMLPAQGTISLEQWTLAIEPILK